jgi:molybdopterin-containing oxidoreductase family iron-sulfur binding subunit
VARRDPLDSKEGGYSMNEHEPERGLRKIARWMRDRVPGRGEPIENSVVDKPLTRRQALGVIFTGAGITTTAGATIGVSSSPKTHEKALLKFHEFFKGNYRVMTDGEKKETIQRLERLATLKHDANVKIKGTPAQPGVLYGYAFNISKCRGYGECINACVKENNQDRKSNMQYIRIFELENGKLDLEDGTAEINHPVPAEGHFYLGTQCFQCADPPCVDVCPVGATWQEPDGITVIDYDWCIGCRYCEAACPYWARRFNWTEPEVPAAEMNPNQHYLGNRMRKKGVMEKCTFCIQRSREGRQPACVEACPTGARVFGNLLDPDSEIRYVLENKKVFRLKEDLGTDPKFWYYMD